MTRQWMSAEPRPHQLLNKLCSIVFSLREHEDSFSTRSRFGLFILLGGGAGGLRQTCSSFSQIVVSHSVFC